MPGLGKVPPTAGSSHWMCRIQPTTTKEVLDMTTRKIEVFSAGCPLCEETAARVKELACPSCEVEIVDMNDSKGATRARALNVHSVPAVAINGELAGCCTGRGPDEATLRNAGLGRPITG